MAIPFVSQAHPATYERFFQEPSKGKPSTTWKTHVLVVLSYLLIGIGIAFACASIYMATVFHPMVAAITPMPFFGAGIFCGQGANARFSHFSTKAPVILPGQPLGIRNRDGAGIMSNCWLVSGFLAAIFCSGLGIAMKKLTDQSEQISKTSPEKLNFFYDGMLDFISSYKKYQNELSNPKNPISEIDIQKLREWMHRFKGTSLNETEEDPSCFLEAIYEKSGIYLPLVEQSFDYAKNKSVIRNETSTSILCIVREITEKKNFNECFTEIFSQKDRHGRELKKWFSEAPKGFFVSIPKGVGELGRDEKNDSAWDIPLHLELTKEQCPKGAREYFCNLFIEHEGFKTGSGHLITYVFHNDQWWRISDQNVDQLSQDEAEEKMKHAYLVHYTQKTVSAA